MPRYMVVIPEGLGTGYEPMLYCYSFLTRLKTEKKIEHSGNKVGKGNILMEFSVDRELSEEDIRSFENPEDFGYSDRPFYRLERVPGN